MMASLGASGPAPDEGGVGEPAGGLEEEGARVAVSSSGKRIRFVAGAVGGGAAPAVGGGAAGGQTGSPRRSPGGAGGEGAVLLPPIGKAAQRPREEGRGAEEWKDQRRQQPAAEVMRAKVPQSAPHHLLWSLR